MLVLPARGVGYALAVPRVRACREPEARRAAVRQTVAAQVQVAQASLLAGNWGVAADALIRAEFPRRVEGHLFRRTELEQIDRQITLLREAVIAGYAKTRREAEEARRLQTERRKREEEERIVSHPAGGEWEIHHRIVMTENRDCTIAALETRATEVLRLGRDVQALGICLQIVDLDPPHRFDDAFWANVKPRP